MYMHVYTDITYNKYHHVGFFWEIYGGDIRITSPLQVFCDI